IKNDFLFPVYEEMALEKLCSDARQAGAVIHENEIFCNFSEESDFITINTSAGSYRTKLAIDAMGNNSMIRDVMNHKNTVLNMGCLAYFLDGTGSADEDEILLYDSFFPGKDYFWVVPLEDGKLMVGLFFFNSIHNGNIREKSEKLRLYIQAKNIKGHVYERRLGNIPLGPQKYLDFSRFILFGDSGNTPLPSSGFSFSQCMDEGKTLCEFADLYLKGESKIDDYKNSILGKKLPGIEVHLLISDMLANFTDEMLNTAIASMNKLDKDFIVSFLSGRDQSINFSIQALKVILTTFSIPELISLTLKQNHFKNIANAYNLLPAIRKAKIGKQFNALIKIMMKKK
ncbi:MAG: hypothetical protein KAR07_10850, partial [Spirochaetes bacterium]|nr:hypothetical protein [Spirochaetota bacterium]